MWTVPSLWPLSMSEPDRRASTLVEIAEAEIEAGNPAGARAVLGALVGEVEARANGEARDGTLANAVFMLVEAGDPARALQAARAIGADRARTELLAYVAGALARAGDAAGAEETLTGLAEAAGAIADAGARADALSALAGAEIEVKKIDAAARTLRSALAAASAVADDEERRWDLIDIAELYARAGDAGRAHDAAERVPDQQWRAHAYFAVARKQTEAGDRLGAAETLAVALRAGRTFLTTSSAIRPSRGRASSASRPAIWPARSRRRAASRTTVSGPGFCAMSRRSGVRRAT